MAGGGLSWRSLTAHNVTAGGAAQPPAGSEPKSIVKRISRAFRKATGQQAGRYSTPVAEIQGGFAESSDGGCRRNTAPHSLTYCHSAASLDQGQWAEVRRSPLGDAQLQHMRPSQSWHSLEVAALEGSPPYLNDRSFSGMSQWDATTIASTRGFSSGSPTFIERTPSWTSHMTPTPQNSAASNCSTPRLSPDHPWLAQQSHATVGVASSPMSARGIQAACAYPHPGNCEIFYMYSSPLHHSALDVRSEVELLSEAIADSHAMADTHANVCLNVGVATAASLHKMLTLAHARRGLVLHLAAHSVNDPERGVGLVLEDSKGAAHVLWREDLEDLLGLRERGLRNISLLFLSTCRSEELAQIFVECGCRHVVAVRQDVHDSSARRFSQQFYLSLAVGEPLNRAWENASCALRLEADKNLAKEADYFVLFGQRNAEKATLQVLCGMEESPCTPRTLQEIGSQIREFEDAAVFFRARLPPRPENFVGRFKEINELLSIFSGTKPRRAIAVSGPKGIGKSALGIEFAHFASAPGRQFSCSAMIVKLESSDLDGLLSAIEDQLQSLARHSHIFPRPTSALSRGSSQASSIARSDSLPGSARSVSCYSESVHSPDFFADGDALSLLFPARQRIMGRLEQLAKCRRKMLLIIDDEAGAVSRSSEVRKILGDFLGQTNLLQILVLSRDKIYKDLGSMKVTNLPLGGLNNGEAAELLLRRIHRPLDLRDFRPLSDGVGSYSAACELPLPLGAVPPTGPGDPGGGGCCVGAAPAAQVLMYPAARRQLCTNHGHPLLRRLEGNPGLIHAVSSRVTPCGPTLQHLAAQSDLLEVASSPVAARTTPCEGFSAKPEGPPHSAVPLPLPAIQAPAHQVPGIQAPPPLAHASALQDASPSHFDIPPLPGLQANSPIHC